MAAGDLRAEVFAQLVRLMEDLRKGNAAQLLELRAIRLSLADDKDSPEAKAAAGKAEGETTMALANAQNPAGGGLDVIESVLKQQMTAAFGIDPTTLVPGSEQAKAFELLMSAKMAELSKNGGMTAPAPAAAPSTIWKPS